MYSNPLVFLVILLLNLARPVTCTGQSPSWACNEQERQLFLPGTLRRGEKEIGGPLPTCQWASRLAWATLSSSGLARALAACRLHLPSTKGSHQGWQGLGLQHRYSGEKKRDGNRAQIQVHGKQHPFFPGTREHCTQPTHRSLPCSREEVLGLVFYRAWQWLGLRSSRSCGPPHIMHNKHLASCAVICGQTPSLLWPQSWAKAKG